MERKQTGRIGLSSAIQYFTIQGYTVSLPINDTQWYDLIIEKDGVFQTVQCKATMTDRDQIKFSSTGGTKGKIYDHLYNHPCDLLFCVNKDLNCWLFPIKDLEEAGVVNSILLRTEYAPSAHPQIDTTKYLVQKHL